MTFTPLAPLAGRRYMMIMATDGVWDHMNEQLPVVQESKIAEYVRQTMSHRSRPLSSSHQGDHAEDDLSFCVAAATEEDGGETDTDAVIQETLQKLGVLAHGLCDREMAMCKSNLFTPGYIRYDDCTAFVVMIDGPHEEDEEVEEESHDSTL